MSRIGRRPIAIPSGVKIHMDDNRVKVEGPKGKLSIAIPPGLAVEITQDRVHVNLQPHKANAHAAQGLGRSLIANMIEGVANNFSKQLQIEGVGFKAESTGKLLSMYLGFTHPVVIHMPDGIVASVEKQTLVTVTGADKQLVGDVAARIRNSRPPEPYKGKGVRYANEQVRRKAGKAAATGTGGKK